MNTVVTSTMNKDIFWGLLEDARTFADGDLNQLSKYLHDQLLQMNLEDIKKFICICSKYGCLADKKGLWEAASIIKDGCTDDAFVEFTYWLIAQGKETYLAVLKNPDILADIEISKDETYGTAEFADLLYLGYTVYEELTGEECVSLDRSYQEFLETDLAQDIEYMDGISDWFGVSEIIAKFPNLAKKYMQEV